MNSSLPTFRAPSAAERIFNRLFGFLIGIGLGFSYNFLLEVRGRKSGKLYSTPINLLELNGKRFLVAPRGRTQWVRNAEAAGEVVLKKGSTRRKFRLRLLADAEKPEVLKAYLDTFKREVQRYFPVPAGSASEVFVPLLDSYPAFELVSQ
ncbi:MAG TPA: nitroreductase family deazaflavin-dependent oxidoreductase [Terriglobales bacterium]|nr:nitroreductase family deazaflavin-dependent oxidoreductase [Terriglobales bacterium]